MKSFLLVCMLSVMTALQSQSNRLDSITVSRAAAERVKIAADQNNVSLEKIAVLESNISNLNAKISNYEKLLALERSKDATRQSIIDDLNKNIGNMKDQRGLFEGEVKALNKEVRKQKRKVFFTAVSGVIIVAGVLFLTK